MPLAPSASSPCSFLSLSFSASIASTSSYGTSSPNLTLPPMPLLSMSLIFNLIFSSSSVDIPLVDAAATATIAASSINTTNLAISAWLRRSSLLLQSLQLQTSVHTPR
eukprot:CAMPEP_0198734310 /NCGR_PEP_ID=MMETSP1475-20131203/51689_1 /TAXON_ID= ORGANISM="Unidentified sp., Strain CCMP1999" /NCGR_SAMPLE_ID=MMETSP1475 /ASSEMBLY_ACC=CAM_ASM_001111 /LENGTH=107 /DNA_ID=CAMNT_0044497757 /DNA_START=262 /DNA_END=585 /DNA_ORIENTATION=-